MTEPVPFRLSYPPSANGLWRNVNGTTLIARQYRAWRKVALTELMVQRPAKIPGPYRLTLIATRPDNRRRDLGNLEKAVSDLLQAAGVVRDDCDAQSTFLAWSASKPDRNGGVSITLEAVG